MLNDLFLCSFGLKGLILVSFFLVSDVMELISEISLSFN